MKIDREIDFNGKKATIKWQSPKMEKDLMKCAELLKGESDLPKFYQAQADAMLTFADGLPSIEFFQSEDFPYGLLSGIFDFLFPSAKKTNS